MADARDYAEHHSYDNDSYTELVPEPDRSADAEAYEAQATPFNPGDAVQVAGYSGVAWRVIGPHTESQWVEFLIENDGLTDDDDDEVYDIGDWEEVETGQIDVHMVGDDRTFTFEPEELSALSEDDFCPSCGQIGCGHGRL